MIKILAIESSCDETAAAVVADGYRLLANVVATQIPVHQLYGGVVPEIASREHLNAVVPVVERALAEAGLGLADLDAVAVTQGPGLIGSLLVGVSYAKALALAAGLPLLAVHHLAGHMSAPFWNTLICNFHIWLWWFPAATVGWRWRKRRGVIVCWAKAGMTRPARLLIK